MKKIYDVSVIVPGHNKDSDRVYLGNISADSPEVIKENILNLDIKKLFKLYSDAVMAINNARSEDPVTCFAVAKDKLEILKAFCPAPRELMKVFFIKKEFTGEFSFIYNEKETIVSESGSWDKVNIIKEMYDINKNKLDIDMIAVKEIIVYEW